MESDDGGRLNDGIESSNGGLQPGPGPVPTWSPPPVALYADKVFEESVFVTFFRKFYHIIRHIFTPSPPFPGKYNARVDSDSDPSSAIQRPFAPLLL